MRIDVKVESSHPRFVHYIKVDLSKLADDPFMVGALSRFGKMDKPAARQIFKFGTGPEIIVGDYETIGKRRARSTEILLYTEIVGAFEDNSDIVTNGDGKRVHLTGIRLLNEVVTVAAGTHMADAFLKNVYGEEIADRVWGILQAGKSHGLQVTKLNDSSRPLLFMDSLMGSGRKVRSD